MASRIERSWIVKLYVPEGVSAEDLAVLGEQERLQAAFTEFFKWRADLREKYGLALQPIQSGNENEEAPLFPKQDSETVQLLSGTSRNLATQRALLYAGHSGGGDSIGQWEVLPLGMLCRAYLAPSSGERKWSWKDGNPEKLERVVVASSPGHTFCPPVPLSEEARAMELHKVEAFVSWFEARADTAASSPAVPVRYRRKWKPFAAGLERYLEPEDTSSLTELQKGIFRKMYAPRMHRGFLLYGPAGTGKSWSVMRVARKMRMHCVWGYNEKEEPIVGTGAALKGGLQGDLEMRIFALFQRAEAAPWLPTAITVDEVDFTAPSRDSLGSQESGGSLWLERLSDGVRAANITFFATTNVRTNVLEQLVDRLDNVYVGLLDWEDAQNLIELAAEHDWPDDRFPTERPAVALGTDRHRKIASVPYYHAVLLGMTPRAVRNLRTPADISEVQLNSNPWPTLTRGPVPFERLLELRTRALTVQADCGALLRFLLWAQRKKVLSGRVLVDTTRLKEGLIVVEVELVHVRSVLGDGSLLFVDSKGYGHSHAASRRGAGRTFTRAFVLQEQADELGLWAVLARYALSIHATHCTFVSDEFLRSMAGTSTSSADERNRAAIATAIQQYVVNCEWGVTVLPLRYARIQQSEEGALSSTINAHEVWDLVAGGWRCNETHNQLFVLVASEQWEVNALLGSSTIAWQSNEYRQHMTERDEEEQPCEVCERDFSTRSHRETYGCAHTGKVVRYAPPRWETSTVCTSVQMLAEMHTSPDIGLRAKWACCGKPFVEEECARRRHQAPIRFEEAVERRAGGLGHRDVANRWWCNYCCNVVCATGCTPEAEPAAPSPSPPAAAATTTSTST
jgi:ATPase family associated with various cellular activities (AAA)